MLCEFKHNALRDFDDDDTLSGGERIYDWYIVCARSNIVLPTFDLYRQGKCLKFQGKISDGRYTIWYFAIAGEFCYESFFEST